MRYRTECGENFGESVFCRVDKLLNCSATARKVAFANLVCKSRLPHDMLQCLRETKLARQHRTLGPNDRKRQPSPVIALEARPEPRTKERRLARTRRA